MDVTVDGTALDVASTATLAELLDALVPRLEPGRLITRLEVDGTPADVSDRDAMARWELGGAEAVSVSTQAPGEFAEARRREIAIHVRRIADLLAAVADGFTVGETTRANRGLAGAARELALVLDLDRRLAALDQRPTSCEKIAATVRQLGPRLEEAERGQRWPELAALLSEELVPALRATSSGAASARD